MTVIYSKNKTKNHFCDENPGLNLWHAQKCNGIKLVTGIQALLPDNCISSGNTDINKQYKTLLISDSTPPPSQINDNMNMQLPG